MRRIKLTTPLWSVVMIGILVSTMLLGTSLADESSISCPTCPGDTAEDAPPNDIPRLISSNGSARLASASQTSTVIFRTDSGPELDWYQPCNGGDNLIDFYINVHDIDVSTIKSARLTLAVWDVDFDCGSACSGVCERDPVYLNGHLLTTPQLYLTGANNQWSTCSFDVDPSWMVEGDNYVQIFIDTLSNECWCVECDWAELAVDTEGIDLRVESKDISISSRAWWAFWANPFDISATVHNDGTVKAENVEVKIAREYDNVELITETKTIGEIPAGGSATVTVNWNLDFDDDIEVIVDPQNKLKDTNRDNNIAKTTKTTGEITDKDGNALENVRVTYQEPDGTNWIDTEVTVFTDSRGEYCLNNNFDYITDGKEGRIRSTLEFSPTRDSSNILLRVYDESEWGNGMSKALNAQTYSAATPSWTMNKMNNYAKDIQYANHNCVLAYKTLVTSYYYWNGLTPSLAPGAEVDVEVNDDDYSSQTSYQHGNDIHIWHTHSIYPSIEAHEYVHVVSDDWGTPYNPIDENFANYGSCKSRNTSLFQFPGVTIDLTNIEDTDGDNVLNGGVSVTNPVWSSQLAGVWWQLVTNEVYEALQEGPDNAREFYNSYDGTPDTAIKKIFRQHGVSTTGWPPAGPGDPDIFTDTFVEYKVDTDSNGLAEYLNIDIGFDIPTPGLYYVYAFLTDATGDGYCFASKEQSLSAGAQTVTLSFDGSTIFEERLSGNYTLAGAYLADQNMEEIDWRIDAYTTATLYDYVEFQPPAIYITDTYSDSGFDTEGDGLFNYLAIDVELNVSTPGDYLAIANLYDSSGDFISYAEMHTHLDTGMQSVRFRFDGLTLRAYQVNGPYILRGVFISNGYYLPVYANDSLSYETSAYLYTQFQEPGAMFSLPIVDYGKDQDGDGLYDYLSVDATVDVNTSTDYTLRARLYSAAGDFIESTSVDSQLDQGSDITSVELDGTGLRESGLDGPFDVALELYNSDGVLISTITHTTLAYAYTQFQVAPEDYFEGTFRDYGTDDNGNGLYDFLAIEADVSSLTKVGDYRVDGYLYDENGDFVTFAGNTTYVDTVPRTVQFHFDGNQIRKTGILDGRYILKLKVFDGNSTLIVDLGDMYITSAYDFIQFDPPPANFQNVYSDYGVDTNSDGLYDYLAINLGVNVISAGDYAVSGWLSGSQIAFAGTTNYLYVGNQTVILNFDGETIYEYGVNGPYNLSELELRDGNSTLVDYRASAYTTSSYSYTQFQRPPVKLTGNYFDQGTDTDSDGLYDYLTMDIGVIVRSAGNYALNARLMDQSEGEIVWAATTSWLSAGQLQTMQLNFDGLSINRHGANGPYYLRDVYVYNMSDVSQADRVYDAYATGAYAYMDFETILNTDLPNVHLIHADQTVDGINVFGMDLSEIDETYKPGGLTSRYAYMIDATGSGNFTLQFTDIPSANNLGVYKIDTTSIPPNQWAELDYTTTAGTVTFSMNVGDPPVVFAELPNRSPVTGITRQVNGDILPEVSITIDGIGPVVSDQSGQYGIMATATGDYTVTAHKDGFRDRIQIVNIAGLGQGYAVTCNFQGQYGLIPKAPDIWYALDCVNRWLYPPNQDTGLDIWTALDVINAWLYPVQ